MNAGTNLKTRLNWTASELAMGRVMRAPDHTAVADGGGAGGGAEAAPAAEAAPEGGSKGEDVLELRSDQMVDEATDDFSAFDKAEKRGEVDSPATGADEKPEGDEKPKGEGDAKPEGDEKPKGEEEPKGSSVQTRIDELTATAREAERRAAAAERELEALRSGKGDAPGTGDEKPGGDAKADGEPDPADYEYGEADAQYIKDSARFHAAAEFQRQQNLTRLEGEFTAIEAGYKERVEKAVERYPDFEQIVTEGAKKETWKASPVMALAMKTSEQGPDVAYYLATHPAESERIAALSPLEQAREMGRLEGKFAFAETPKPPKIVTEAPKPLEGGTRGGSGRSEVAEDTEDFAAFDKFADKKIRT